MNVFYAVYVLLVFCIPLFLGYAFLRLWLRYTRSKFVAKQNYTLLELKLPKEITKSPAAMEIFFTALFQTGAASYLETYIDGKVRPSFSLELVSLEGKVHFYIYTRSAWKNIIETQIYAQYPNVEVHEVEDYTHIIDHGKEMVMWGTYFKKKKEDVYPIKTYIDYGLDENPKEEFKIDPFTSVLEYLGSLHQNEYGWIQIIIQAHKQEGWKEGRVLQGPSREWKEEVKAEVQKIRKETTESTDKEAKGRPNPTKAQQEVMMVLERNLAKFPFECCIRGIYIAHEDIFNNHLGISGLIGSFRQYSSDHLNSISLGWFTDHDDFGKDMVKLFGWISPFKNTMRRRRNRMEQHMLDAYKERGAFEPPFMDHHEPFIMTTEELATIFHFPGEVAGTPSFDRLPAKKADAPANLPI